MPACWRKHVRVCAESRFLNLLPDDHAGAGKLMRHHHDTGNVSATLMKIEPTQPY